MNKWAPVLFVVAERERAVRLDVTPPALLPSALLLNTEHPRAILNEGATGRVALEAYKAHTPPTLAVLCTTTREGDYTQW